jgi:hypothetical protein
MATRISVHDTSTIVHDDPGYGHSALRLGPQLRGESFRETTSPETSSMHSNLQSGKSLLYRPATTRKFLTFLNTTAIAYHTKKRQIHLFVCHAILVVFGNAMKLRVHSTSFSTFSRNRAFLASS